MKKHTFLISGSLALSISSSASADFVTWGVQLGPNQHPDGLHTTYQYYMSFDDAGDQISSVNGLDEDGLNILKFWTSDGSYLYNQALFDGLPFNDFPSAGALGGEPWDTYVTIGETEFPSNTQFTPNFLGFWFDAPPPMQVIEGSSFEESDGGWFFFAAPPTVSSLPDAVKGNDTFDVVIAQFTVNNGVFPFLMGNVAWFNQNGSYNTPFGIIPSPGVLAMFALAGLVGTRRRRE